MPHRILITGASGYLGGTLLARFHEAKLPSFDKLYALVRTADQEKAVQQYGAEPIRLDTFEPEDLKKAVVDNKITIIYHLFDAIATKTSTAFIEGLATVKQETNQEVHFLFTTGAKMFSQHAAAPTDKPLLDTAPNLYEMQKTQASNAPYAIMRQAATANNTVIEKSEALGVRSYIFAPCVVYGKGEGFGNKISIQTVAIVQAAKALRQVYRLEILRGILSGKDIGHGKNGYFLASPGSVAWEDIYSSMAKGLKSRGVVDSDSVKDADQEAVSKMASALQCPEEFVTVQLGGLCTFTAEHGKSIGWTPNFKPEHFLEAADEEAELILQNLKK